MKNSNIIILTSKYLVLTFLQLCFSAFAQNNQITWSVFSTGYGISSSSNTSIRSLIGDPIVGTSANGGSSISNGFFANPASTGVVTGIERQSVLSIPTSYQLSQNYPNPFNPSTNIKFSLPEQSTVKIVIYDLIGRKVKTLINDSRPAGVYNIRWSGENESNVNVSSGIYFYSLYAVGADNKKYTSFKKMILLK
jgi:hypothetical protein